MLLHPSYLKSIRVAPCASTSPPLGDRHGLRLVSFGQDSATYIGVRRQGLFVLASPPLRLGTSLRGGVASRRALALLGGLTVCGGGRLALGRHVRMKVKVQRHRQKAQRDTAEDRLKRETKLQKGYINREQCFLKFATPPRGGTDTAYSNYGSGHKVK